MQLWTGFLANRRNERAKFGCLFAVSTGRKNLKNELIDQEKEVKDYPISLIGMFYVYDGYLLSKLHEIVQQRCNHEVRLLQSFM